MPDNFDKLVGDAGRIRKVSRMVPLSGPLTPVVRSAILGELNKSSYSQADIQDGIGQSAERVSKLLNDRAALPEALLDRMLRDANNWLEREARAAEAQRPAEFVMTRVAERGYAAIEAATERPEIILLTGISGIGKSTVVAAAAEFPTVTALTAGHDTRTNPMLVRAIHAALVRRVSSSHRRIMLGDVIEKLRMPPRVKTRNVLIIDSAHELKPPAYPLLMEIHDKAQCSIVLVGTRDLRTVVSSDNDPEYGQLSSRVGMRVDLCPEIRGSLVGGGQRGAAKCFTVADMRRLFAGAKLKLHSDAARMLCEIANTRRGTLRRVGRIFYWAEKAARQAGADTITVEHLRAAASLVEEEEELPTLASEAVAEATAATA